jgi:hypothetical protein
MTAAVSYYPRCDNKNHIPNPTPPSIRIPRSCLTVTLEGLPVLFGMCSQMGSTSGPSRSPAPSQPQHHTVHRVSIVFSRPWYREDVPCSGPGWNSTSRLSSSMNNLSCGPNHDRSCGSVRGLSGRPPMRTYPLMAVKFRRAGWMISNTFCRANAEG